VERVDGLEAAVARAAALTPTGRTCVFSPASPSYGYFKNFEERGEKFCQYVDGVGR
jgi:UDP-N-acetylmuramoylalanine--D-glutamate ligase